MTGNSLGDFANFVVAAPERVHQPESRTLPDVGYI